MSSIKWVVMSEIVLWLCISVTVPGACGQMPSRAPEALRSTDSDSAQTLAAGEAETSNETPTTVEGAANPLFPIRKDWKWGYMNRDGKVVIEPRYDDAEPFYEGLAAVKLGEKWGYVDQCGKLVVSAQYAMAGRFSEGRAAVIRPRDVRWPMRVGHIDTAGKVVIKPEFFGGMDAEFHDGLALVRPKGAPITGVFGFEKRNRYIDRSGTFAIDTVFDCATPFSDGLAKVWKDGKTMYIDTSGNVVLDVTSFHNTGDFSEGLASVTEPLKRGRKIGFINREGQVVIAPAYDRVHGFSEGLAAVAIGWNDPSFVPKGLDYVPAKWGYIDRKGKLVIEPNYWWVGSFSEGLACVELEKGGKHGFINQVGELVIKPRFDTTWGFRNRLARVSIDNRWVKYETPHGKGKRLVHGRIGYIDHAGEYVWPPTE